MMMATVRTHMAHAEEPRAISRSWLCRNDFDRERMLDMQKRMDPVRRRSHTIVILTVVFLGPWLGWWPLLIAIPAVVAVVVTNALMARAQRPEYLMFASWIVSTLAIAAVAWALGGPLVPTLSWLAIPALTLSSRFSMRGVLVGVALSVALLFGVAFGVDAHAVIGAPVLVAAPLALILCAAVLTTPLMHSDIEHRGEAIIDQLTGMLNRKALSARAAELGEQSRLNCEPVGVIVGDLDHFKRINDTQGHTVGDAVLKNVAYVLRKQLRAFDLAYRIGGEEFVVLLPGSNLERAAELAACLCEAVRTDRVGGDPCVTMSFGVAASERGETFDYEAVFAKADAALYRAKQRGRDRVCSAELQPFAEAMTRHLNRRAVSVETTTPSVQREPNGLAPLEGFDEQTAGREELIARLRALEGFLRVHPTQQAV
jgi:diguanylate cyclase (GGDEF)-like protein